MLHSIHRASGTLRALRPVKICLLLMLSIALVTSTAGCRKATDPASSEPPGGSEAAADAGGDPAGDTSGEAGDSTGRSDADETDASEEVDLAAVDAQWPTELYSGESGPTRKLVLDAIAAGGPLSLDDLPLTDDFQGEDFSNRAFSDTTEQSGITISDWADSDPAALDGPAFVERFNDWLGEYEIVETTEIHTWELQIPETDDGTTVLEAVEALWVVGQDTSGAVREDRLELVFELVKSGDPIEESSEAPTDATASDGGASESEDEAETESEADVEEAPEYLWKLRNVHSRAGRTLRTEDPYFRDITHLALEGGYDQAGAQVYTEGGPALADFDADGDLDLFVPRMHAPMLLYTNDGEGRFEEVSVEWGLHDNAQATSEDSNSGVFVDYDQDGRLDLLVGFKSRGLRVFHNEGDRFLDVTGPVERGGLGQWQTIAVADYDLDGLPDLYLGNYNLIDDRNQPESYVDAQDGLPNALLRNLGDGRFEDVTDAVGMGVENFRWTYAAAWGDYDADGDPDLYVANDYGPNQLFRNDGLAGGDAGGWRFSEVSEEVGARDFGNGMGVSWFDYDNDADLDLYVSNMQSFAGNRITRLDHFPGTPEQRALYRRFSQGNSLLRNDGDAGFVDATEEAGIKSAFWSWGNTPLDYDNDGDLDIFVSAGFYTGASTADT